MALPGDTLGIASTGLHLFHGWRKERFLCLPKPIAGKEEQQEDAGGAGHLGRPMDGAQEEQDLAPSTWSLPALADDRYALTLTAWLRRNKEHGIWKYTGIQKAFQIFM